MVERLSGELEEERKRSGVLKARVMALERGGNSAAAPVPAGPATTSASTTSAELAEAKAAARHATAELYAAQQDVATLRAQLEAMRATCEEQRAALQAQRAWVVKRVSEAPPP